MVVVTTMYREYGRCGEYNGCGASTIFSCEGLWLVLVSIVNAGVNGIGKSVVYCEALFVYFCI